MTTDPTPQKRLNDLVAVVDGLEAGFGTHFTDWKEQGYTSPDDYFLQTYETTVDTLKHITDEKWKDDADPSLKGDLDSLFAHALMLLPKSVEHVRTTGPRLGRLHKKLLGAMLRLAERGDVTGSNGLGVHLAAMGDQLSRIKPPPRAAWNAATKDLHESEEFEDLFLQFLSLKKDPHNKQKHHELYVYSSHRLLGRALRALSLPEHEAYPENNFFNNESRPTFVEYPYGSKEFFYGRGSRPGILHIKSKLGSPLTADEKKILRGLDKEKSEEATKEKVGAAKKKQNEQKKTQNTKKKGSEEKDTKGKKKQSTAEKGNKKRSKPGSSKGSKRLRTKWNYTMTLVNAAADVEDILRVSKYKGMWDSDAERPDGNRLVTPTVEIRKTTLVAYREDLRYIIEDLFKNKFRTPTSRAKLPQTADERKAWLDLADRELRLARAVVLDLMEKATSPAKAKQLRLAAYKLKLARALHMLGLLSGEPAASAEEIRQGLQDRLEDWALYEEAWNVSELVTLQRQGVTQELWDTITGNVKERAENVARWAEMHDQLRKESASGKKGKDEKKDKGEKKSKGEEEKPGKTFTPIYSSSSSEEEEEDEEEEEIKEEEEIEVDNSGLVDVPEGEIFLTDEEISNGRRLLRNVLHPRRPNAGDYLLDSREEGRRRRWFRAMAVAKLTGQPIPKWTHKAPSDPFAAEGPPGWENIPISSVWDRLQFMWVHTNWRFFQLRELEP
ncbi:hypothetical protein GGR58DRAFT_510695 [Xylaria digitata]|nr:hypothetical protein GGR58DRAFT_510695 [Xylaria digitata]